jgi:hypothetical protein
MEEVTVNNTHMTVLATALFLLSHSAFADSPVTFERLESHLLIKINGSDFAKYVWNDPSVKRTYFAHIRSPKGVQVTRSFPPIAGRDATDHATMHPGLWLAFGDISGADFWRNKGVVRHAGFVEDPVTGFHGGRFAVKNLYQTDGKTICEEVCRIRLRVTRHGYLIEWESKFSGAAFTFGDQEEMGLGIRVATGLSVAEGGEITSSEGRKNEKQVWGRQADWCDYSGRGAGITLVPDPKNFRPSWFHARDYGLLVANPFGRQAFTKGEPSRVVVKRGETLTLRFGVLVHDDDLDRHAAYQDFLQTGSGNPITFAAWYIGWLDSLP